MHNKTETIQFAVFQHFQGIHVHLCVSLSGEIALNWCAVNIHGCFILPNVELYQSKIILYLSFPVLIGGWVLLLSCSFALFPAEKNTTLDAI